MAVFLGSISVIEESEFDTIRFWLFYLYTIRNYKTFSVTLLNTEALKEGKIKVTVSTIMNKGSLTFIIVAHVCNDNILKRNTVIE